MNKFTFEIVYKAGKKNVIADALSRRPDLSANPLDIILPGEELHEKLIEGYLADLYFATVYHALKNPEQPVNKSIASKIRRFKIDEIDDYCIIWMSPMCAC